VIYGTTDGQTGKMARALGDAMRAHGAEVEVVEAAGAVVNTDAYDGTRTGTICAPSRSASSHVLQRSHSQRRNGCGGGGRDRSPAFQPF
jgi:hypothetical protein